MGLRRRRRRRRRPPQRIVPRFVRRQDLDRVAVPVRIDEKENVLRLAGGVTDADWILRVCDDRHRHRERSMLAARRFLEYQSPSLLLARSGAIVDNVRTRGGINRSPFIYIYFFNYLPQKGRDNMREENHN